MIADPHTSVFWAAACCDPGRQRGRRASSPATGPIQTRLHHRLPGRIRSRSAVRAPAARPAEREHRKAHQDRGDVGGQDRSAERGAQIDDRRRRPELPPATPRTPRRRRRTAPASSCSSAQVEPLEMGGSSVTSPPRAAACRAGRTCRPNWPGRRAPGIEQQQGHDAQHARAPEQHVPVRLLGDHRRHRQPQCAPTPATN